MSATTPALIFNGAGTPLELRDLALMEPTGSEILVRVVACTLCGSDLHSVTGRRSVPVPTILGHETLGRIVQFGPSAPRIDAIGSPLKERDRVTWSVVANCGECFFCARELPQKCERQLKYGHEAFQPGRELTGGLAGHCMLVAGTSVVRIPDELSDAAACPANCAGATVGAAIEVAGTIAGRSILIMGSGMLGVTAIAWARWLGAKDVIACELDPHRRQLAQMFGAHIATTPADLVGSVHERTDGRGADVVIELSGSSDAVEAAIPLARMGGTIVLIGSVFPSRAIDLFPERIVRNCLTIRGIHNYAPRHLAAAVRFLTANRHLPLEDLVTEWVTLSAVPRAILEPLPEGKLRLGTRP